MSLHGPLYTRFWHWVHWPKSPNSKSPTKTTQPPAGAAALAGLPAPLVELSVPRVVMELVPAELQAVSSTRAGASPARHRVRVRPMHQASPPPRGRVRSASRRRRGGFSSVRHLVARVLGTMLPARLT